MTPTKILNIKDNDYSRSLQQQSIHHFISFYFSLITTKWFSLNMYWSAIRKFSCYNLHVCIWTQNLSMTLAIGTPACWLPTVLYILNSQFTSRLYIKHGCLRKIRIVLFLELQYLLFFNILLSTKRVRPKMY